MNMVVPEKTIEMRIASDAAFFVEVIRIVFRSDKEERVEKSLTDDQKNLTQNAYRLLHGWQTVPGTKADGGFDEKSFVEWLEQVSQHTKESGHYRVA